MENSSGPANTASEYALPKDERRDFFSLTRADLASFLEEKFGLSSYRADQMFQWVYQKGISDTDSMTNIKKELRMKLQGIFDFPSLAFHSQQISQDGTRKYVFEFESGNMVEAVMIKQPSRMTLCVSSQVGCALGCKFCQTGTMGLAQNLSVSQIVRQVLGIIEDSKNFDDSFSNLVFMGMGEPLHNFDNVIKAISILNDDFGPNLSARKITVSTAGLIPQIKQFFESGVEANLAISLNATTEKVRSELMPINRKYSLKDLMHTLRSISLKPRQRITIEYVMLAGINDSNEDLARLPALLKNIPSKINLIPYNGTSSCTKYSQPPRSRILHWQQELMKKGYVSTIRWSKGPDISAACGQLVTDTVKLAV